MGRERWLCRDGVCGEIATTATLLPISSACRSIFASMVCSCGGTPFGCFGAEMVMGIAELCTAVAMALSSVGSRMLGRATDIVVPVTDSCPYWILHQENDRRLIFDVCFSSLFTTYMTLNYHCWVSTLLESRHDFYKWVLLSSFPFFLRTCWENPRNGRGRLSRCELASKPM